MSILASYELVNDWGSGFKGEITLTNTGTEPIVDWQLAFTFDADIEDIWRANIVSRDGNNYIVRGESYSDTIEAGESVVFSFKADGDAAAQPVFEIDTGTGDSVAGPTDVDTGQVADPVGNSDSDSSSDGASPGGSGSSNNGGSAGGSGSPSSGSGPIINVATGTSAAEMQSIIDDAPAGATVRLAAGEFSFDRTVTIARDDITIEGAGSDATRIMADFARGQEGAVFEIREGGMSGSYGLARNAQEGDTSITLSGGHDISAGDFIWMERPNTQAFFREIGDTSWLKDKPLQTSIARVDSVNGNTLTLENGIHFDYDTSDATVRRLEMAENVNLRGFSIDTPLGEPDPGDLSNTLSAYDRAASVHLYGTYNARLDDIEVHDSGSKAFLFEKTLEMNGTELLADGSHNKGAGGNGYAFELKDVYESSLSGLEDHGMRHSVIFGSWYSAVNNTVDVRFTDRDINFHGGRDHGNVVRVETSERQEAYDNMSSVVSYNIDGESWGAPTDPDANTITFGRVLGSRRDDVVQGNDSGVLLDGRGANDTLTGGAGDDTLIGGTGDDVLVGGGGSDAAVFSGDRSDYSLDVLSNGRLRVDGADGTDTLSGIERLRFDGGETISTASLGEEDVEAQILGVGSLAGDDMA